ncbi:MAG: hypothetical protein JO115_18905 [Pseudonocardiales bacterium]|nr:hypothetical protein [Pseudonocardiales bacterium]
MGITLAAEDLESIETTLELLANTRAQERIRRSEADFTAGDVVDEQQVRALIDERHRTHPE